MKDYQSIDLIDINKKKGFPRTYRFSLFTRWFTIILALLAILYAAWYIITAVDADTSTFRKIIPFIIIFLAGNSLFRNLFTLNNVSFFADRIEFGYILAKNISIPWDNIVKLHLYTGKTRAIVLIYNDNNRQKQLIFTMVFPNMLEIINSIAEMCPQAEYDTFIKNIIISDTEGKQTRS